MMKLENGMEVKQQQQQMVDQPRTSIKKFTFIVY